VIFISTLIHCNVVVDCKSNDCSWQSSIC